MPYDFNNTEYWFDRAKELRTRVDLMRDRGNREIMLRIADDYERLGRRAAERREREETPLKSRKPRWTAGNHRRVAWLERLAHILDFASRTQFRVAGVTAHSHKISDPWAAPAANPLLAGCVEKIAAGSLCGRFGSKSDG